jgi:long-subunit fatty acid transport protein
MLHVSVSSNHPQAFNTYLKLKIKCICIEFVRSYKLDKSFKFYVALKIMYLMPGDGQHWPTHVACVDANNKIC